MELAESYLTQRTRGVHCGTVIGEFGEHTLFNYFHKLPYLKGSSEVTSDVSRVFNFILNFSYNETGKVMEDCRAANAVLFLRRGLEVIQGIIGQ